MKLLNKYVTAIADKMSMQVAPSTGGYLLVVRTENRFPWHSKPAVLTYSDCTSKGGMYDPLSGPENEMEVYHIDHFRIWCDYTAVKVSPSTMLSSIASIWRDRGFKFALRSMAVVVPLALGLVDAYDEKEPDNDINKIFREKGSIKPGISGSTQASSAQVFTGFLPAEK